MAQLEGIETGGLAIGDVPLLIGYAILMLGVCALACVVPTLSALRAADAGNEGGMIVRAVNG